MALVGKRIKDGTSAVSVRDPFSVSDPVEVVPPEPGRRPFRLTDFRLSVRKDGKTVPVTAVKIQDKAFLSCAEPPAEGAVLRMKKKDGQYAG